MTKPMRKPRPQPMRTLWTFILSGGLLLVLIGALAGCGGKVPPVGDPCTVAKTQAAVVCALDPASPACAEAKKTVDAVCKVPPPPPPPAAHEPLCQGEGKHSCWVEPSAGVFKFVCYTPWTSPTTALADDPKLCPSAPPPPPPPPPASFCSDTPAALTIDSAAFTQVTQGVSPQTVSYVRAAEATLRAECPLLFDPDGKLAKKTGAGINEFNWRIAAILARSKIVAGQSIEKGELQDKLYVQRGDKRWEAFHTCSYADFSVLDPANAQKNGGFWEGEPGEQPPPTVDLSPLPDRAKVEFDCKPSNDRFDCTEREVNGGHADAYGFPGRYRYPLGPDLSDVRFGRERYGTGDDSGSTAPPEVPNPFARCEGQGGDAFQATTTDPAERAKCPSIEEVRRGAAVPGPLCNWSQCIPTKGVTAIRMCWSGGCSPWVSR